MIHLYLTARAKGNLREREKKGLMPGNMPVLSHTAQLLENEREKQIRKMAI
jgi:hypothetical protein